MNYSYKNKYELLISQFDYTANNSVIQHSGK